MNSKWRFQRLFRPADDGDAGGGGGGTADRGDDFAPTPDEPKVAEPVEVKPADDAAKGEGATLRDPDPDADADADADADPKAAKGAKETRIPLKRHQAVLDRERAQRADLERQLAQYQNGAKVADVNAALTATEDSVASMEKEYSSLLADGKLEAATAKMAEIRRTERSIITQQSALDLAAVEARAVETVRYNTTLERVEDAYPALNPDGQDYDKDVMAEVVDLKMSFQARGYTPSVALQRAVKYVMGEPTTTRQAAATTATARVDKAAVEKEVAVGARKAGQVAKNIDAALKTPPSTAKIGIDSDKIGGGVNAKNVMNMSYKDFSKLDDATLSAMRGDELAA